MQSQITYICPLVLSVLARCIALKCVHLEQLVNGHRSTLVRLAIPVLLQVVMCWGMQYKLVPVCLLNVHVCGLLSAGVMVEFDRTLLTTREDILTLSVCLVKTGNTTIENSADVIACNRSLPNHLPAVDGADYSRSSIVQTITFAPEESRKCFVVGIIDDEVVEGSEAFGACVKTESFSVEIGSNDSVTVVIMDNDGERPGYLWIYI